MQFLTKKCSLAIIIYMLCWTTGCQQTTVPKSTVGLIDMDLVLTKTGRLKVIEAELAGKRNEIQSNLKLIEKGLLSNLQEKQKSFGEKPTPEQEKTLQQEGMKAQQLMQGKSREMERDFNEFIGKTREKYITNEINPVIQTICQEKSYYLVLLKNQAIVHDKTIDITEDVISRLGVLPDIAPEASSVPTSLPGMNGADTQSKPGKPLPTGDIKFDTNGTNPPNASSEAPKSMEKSEPDKVNQADEKPTNSESATPVTNKAENKPEEKSVATSPEQQPATTSEPTSAENK